MADEIMEAIQILRFTFDGLKLGIDITGSSISKGKDLAIFIVGLLNREKNSGKTSLEKMLAKSGSLQVLQVKDEDLKAVTKMAKRYGILYSKLPDVNKSDGMTEILFPTEATPRINALMEKFSSCKLETLTDYANNKDGNYDKTLKFLQDNKFLPSETISITGERKRELDNVAKNVKYNEKINSIGKTDISISESLYVDESLDAIKTRIPYTYGDNARFIWINKEDVIPINNGKTYIAFLDKDKEYEVYDRDGNVASKNKGEQLKEEHYSNVGNSARRKALIEKAKKDKLKENAQLHQSTRQVR